MAALRVIESIGADIVFLEPRYRAGEPACRAVGRFDEDLARGDVAMFLVRFGEYIAHLRAQRGKQSHGGFLAEVADQFFVFLIVQQHAFLFVEQHDGDLCRIHHRLDQCLLVLHLAFQPVHFGHVSVHAEVMRGETFFSHHRGDGDVRQVAVAVLALVHQQAVPRTLPLYLRPQRFIDQFGCDVVRQN